MDASSQSGRSLSTSSSSSASSSSPYADVESNNASSVDLLTYNKTPTPSTSPQSRPSSSITKTIAVISLMISSLCFVCVVGLSCWVFGFDENSPFFSKLVRGEERREVCVPCLQVSPDPLDNASGWSLWEELTVRSDEENDTKICCAVTAAQYAALFKLILQRQQEVQKLAGYLEGSNDTEEVGNGVPVAQQMVDPKTPVSAHLVFKPWPYRSPAVSEDKWVQHWQSPAESSMSHVLPGLKLQHSTRLLVQTPGLYYVYCQFLYTPGPSSPKSSQPSDVSSSSSSRDPDVSSAYVRRYSLLHPSAGSFLLKSRHTRQEAGEDRHSSYVGGVLRLYLGDALYVQVSKPQLISHDEVASFFGLFKVGP